MTKEKTDIQDFCVKTNSEANSGVFSFNTIIYTICSYQLYLSGHFN